MVQRKFLKLPMLWQGVKQLTLNLFEHVQYRKFLSSLCNLIPGASLFDANVKE